MTLLLVGLGGFFGAMTRYAVDALVTSTIGDRFPWGTLVVNLSGSFLLGLLVAMGVERGILPDIRAPVLIGFIGAYTTFSTLMLDAWRLGEQNSYLLAFANIGGSILLGLAAVFAGLALGRAV